jgi:hypothetical protein
VNVVETMLVRDFSNEIDVIFHNMDMRSDFRTFRTRDSGDIKDTPMKLGRESEAGGFDKLISFAASKNPFVIVMATNLSRDELEERGMFS